MNKYIYIFICIFMQISAMAFDIDEYKDFSSRSIIMQSMQRQTNVSYETKLLLKSKKLNLTTQCLVKQIEKSNYDNVNLLLNAGVDPNKSYYTQYPIYIAAKKNNFEILKLLYSKGAKLDKGFYSELYEAVKNKNIQMIQFLIDNNANINYVDMISSNSILYLALKKNMIDIAFQLINKGARIDARTYVLLKKKKINIDK